MRVPYRFRDWKMIKKTGLGYSKREITVVRLLKKLSENHTINSFLNIGFHDYQSIRKRWWIDLCKANGIDWHIVEIFKQNCDNFIQHAPPEDRHRITHGDIKNISQIFDNNFDIVFHFHGPEHLLKDEYIDLLPEIESAANKMIILGCPNGVEEQGAAYGNPFEKHLSFWTEEDFQNLGYNTILVSDKKPGHITAYKFKVD